MSRFAELLGLSGLIVAEPLLTALRSGADVFVSRRADPLHIIGLTTLIVFALPLVAFLAEALVGLISRKAQDQFHTVIVAALGGLVVIRVCAPRDVPEPLVALLAVMGAIGLGVAVARWGAVRQWLQLIGIFPLLLTAWFLGTDPVRGLLLDPAAATGESVAVGDPAPVVMIVLDEFPLLSILDDENRISAEQFPNLAGLTEDATWFRNATGVSPTTPEAVPPILTGRYPEAVGLLPTVQEHPNNLFTLLQGTFGMHVQESVTQLCPADLCARGALATGNPLVELTRDAVDLWQRQLFGGEGREVDFAIRQSDPDAPATITRFAEEIERGERPELDFLHAVYPHQPWYHLPTGATYEAPFIAEGLDQFSNYEWKTEWAADLGRQRHLLQARHADVMVGLVLARLRELGTYDDSLIVVTADHGASFRVDEPLRGVSADNVDGVLWVPLLVKAPGQTSGRIDDRPARTIDVLPTLADLLAIDLPGTVDGQSLFGPPPPAGPDERRVYDWGFNTLVPNTDGYASIDGERGFQQMLDQPAPGVGDDAELRFHRFGRHADLVGLDVDELAPAPALDLEVELDPDGGYRGAPDAQQDVYIAGEVGTPEALDVAVAVNGRIGGWAELQATGDPNERRFWVLVPARYLDEDGEDVIELFAIDDDGRLAPI